MNIFNAVEVMVSQICGEAGKHLINILRSGKTNHENERRLNRESGKKKTS